MLHATFTAKLLLDDPVTGKYFRLETRDRPTGK